MTITPDTIPDRAELPPLPECDSYCTHKHLHDYEVFTAEQMREYALAARSLAGTPQAEPLKAAPDAVSEREAFEKWMTEDGKWPEAVMRNDDQYRLAQAASAWTAWQAAWQAAWEARATHSAAPAAVGEHRARLLFLADCIDRNPRIEHDADDATYFRELAAFFSAPMPAGAAVGDAPRVAKPAPPSDIELLKVYTRMHQGQRVPESKRDLFLKYARIGIAATTPTTGGASTPTGGAQP